MPEKPYANPDLTQHPPRSARTQLGGYALLPRMLDKGRAELAGRDGEYHFGCPLDQQFLSFVGVEAAAVREQLATGKGDREMIEWITANAKTSRSPWEIQQWSQWQGTRVPADAETREFFTTLHKGASAEREDIATWADLLDLDDYVSFGGKA